MDLTRVLYLISDNDQKAFERFYHHYYEQIFRFAYYFLQNKEACREVISNVFFSVWQSRKKLPEIRNVETYLYVTTRNEANRYLSRYSHQPDLSIDEIPLQFEASGDPSPEEELLAKELSALVNRTVNELPEKCRLIFLMTHKDGLKPKEIAEILTLNESTVRVQLKIALDKIMERLRPHFPDLFILFCLVLNIYK